jgi:hypothetical protein
MATTYSQIRKLAPASFEQRAEPRLRLLVTHASVRRYGKLPIEATLHDLSSYGCRIEAALVAKEGERVWLRFEGRMPIAANVVWCAEGKIGCRFDAPLDRAVMRALTLRLV